MKIEKINNTQFRCTLNEADLSERHIDLVMFSYGTDRADQLFAEVMEFAEQHFGFSDEGLPLVIEAIPHSSGMLELLVTTVGFPEELDARFATFSDMPDDLDLFYPEDESYMEEIPLGKNPVNAGDILSMSNSASSKTDKQKDGTTLSVDPSKLIRLYHSNSLDDLISLGRVLKGYYEADNALYHAKADGYYLLLNIGDHTAVEFNKVCNVASEYATMRNISTGTEQYFAEHTRPVLPHYALQTLGSLPRS